MSSPIIVLLAGSPHGGANIANIILGQHPQLFATGELKNFPHGRQIMDERVCSCGEKSTHCPFWLKVREAYAPHEEQPDAVRLPVLYEIISRLSQRRYIGDVAQDFVQAERLCGMPGLDVRLIHVVRDGRAVVNAGIRPAREAGGVRTVGWQRLARTAKVTQRWQRQDNHLSALVSRMGHKGLRISYDDLCEDPRTNLNRIGRFLDLDLDAIAERTAAGQPLSRVPHLLRGGNKFAKQASIVLRHDDRFRRELTSLELCVFRVVSALNRRLPGRAAST